MTTESTGEGPTVSQNSNMWLLEWSYLSPSDRQLAHQVQNNTTLGKLALPNSSFLNFDFGFVLQAACQKMTSAAVWINFLSCICKVLYSRSTLIYARWRVWNIGGSHQHAFRPRHACPNVLRHVRPCAFPHHLHKTWRWRPQTMHSQSHRS